MWYKLAKSEIVIEGPTDGRDHYTHHDDFLDYLIFTAKDSATNKPVGYILFHTPKDDITRETKEKAEKSFYIRRRLENSFTGQIVVKEDLRRQGIGSRLYAAVDNYLKKHNKPKLTFFNYKHLSPAAQRVWDKRLESKTASKDATYFSIGHSRDYDSIILWVHDGQQLHTKTSTPKQKTHMSAFQGINDIARGRIDKAKNISSIAFDIDSSISVMQQNYLRKKVLSDLKKQFPTVNISEHGQILKEEDDKFASSNLGLKTAQFGAGYGEWWIDDSGQTMYADIDIGDKGHEAFVIEHAQSLLIPSHYHTYSEHPWQDFLNTLAEDLLDEAHANKNLQTHIEEYVRNDLASIDAQELIDQGYIEDYILKEFKPNQQILDIAMGRGDVRLYGVKELGWKRVMNNFVETWFFRPQDCDIIARGLGDIAQDDEEGTTKWTIEVRSANKVYSNIPLYIIDQGPVAVSNYSRQLQD